MKTIESGKNNDRAHKDTARSRPSAQAVRGGGGPRVDRPDVPRSPSETPELLQRKLDTAFGTQERGHAFPRWQTGCEAVDASPPAAALTPSMPGSWPVQSAVVQRMGGADHPATHEIATEGVKGSGQPLPYLQRLQQSFGSHDLSGVRSFTTDQASFAARRIGAQAYTTGDRIAFSDGNPSLHTVAHEAAHVVQQRAGVQLKGGIGQAGDVYEQHADAVADAVVSGRSAEPLLAQSPEANPKSAQARPAAVQRIKAEDMGLLMAMAELEAPGFHSLMKTVAAKSKCEYKYRKGLKSVSRSIVKAKEYQADLEKKKDDQAELHGAESMIDMIAGSLIFNSLGDLAAGYGILRATLDEKGATIVRLKNRIEKAHLRDFLLNIKMPSGFIVELQLHLAPTIGAKMGKPVKVDADSSGKGGHTDYTAHDAYDYQRIIDPFIGIINGITFSTYIDPLDENEKYELAKERTLSRYMGAGTKDDLSAYLKLEPYKKKTEEELKALSTELNTMYSEVMNELMTKAWNSISSQQSYADDYEVVKAIKSREAVVRQDLESTRSHWAGKARFNQTESKKADLKRLIKTHQVDAKTALNVPESEDRPELKTLKALYKDLNNVRAEKKTKHPETVKDPAGIDKLISLMKKIVTMLERQSDVEKAVRRVKQRALERKRADEKAKLKEIAARAAATTVAQESTE